MSELRTYKIAPFLILSRVQVFSDDEIADMLTRAEVIWLDLGPGSALEDLTLSDLDILTAETGLAN